MIYSEEVVECLSEEHGAPKAGKSLACRCRATERAVCWKGGESRQEPGRSQVLESYSKCNGRRPRAFSRKGFWSVL